MGQRKGKGGVSSLHRGRVLEVSRRFVTVLTEDGSTVTGTLSAKSLDLVAGDIVEFESKYGELFVRQGHAAERSLYRTFHDSLKRMGANIDLLCVITASGPTWNPVAIDRMLAAGTVQHIPTVLVVNKVDLGLGDIKSMVGVYARVGVRVMLCSAKQGDGIPELRALVEQDAVHVIALCGVSGVGKSSILNALIPGTRTRTGDVSEKTGQGKQTTSQPKGFLYPGDNAVRKMIIDLPGVQFFGLAHLTPHDVSGAFHDILDAAQGCRFRDCRHVKEKECAVREAVEKGIVAPWRYHSYLQILDEIEEAKEY